MIRKKLDQSGPPYSSAIPFEAMRYLHSIADYRLFGKGSLRNGEAGYILWLLIDNDSTASILPQI